MTLPDEIAAAARAIANAAGMNQRVDVPALAHDIALNMTTMVERAVKGEREACAKIVDAKMDKLHETQRMMEQDAESGEEHASGISELALAAETEAMLCFELSEAIRSRTEPARGGEI